MVSDGILTISSKDCENKAWMVSFCNIRKHITTAKKRQELFAESLMKSPWTIDISMTALPISQFSMLNHLGKT
jgi:hypothetical protein